MLLVAYTGAIWVACVVFALFLVDGAPVTMRACVALASFAPAEWDTALARTPAEGSSRTRSTGGRQPRQSAQPDVEVKGVEESRDNELSSAASKSRGVSTFRLQVPILRFPLCRPLHLEKLRENEERRRSGPVILKPLPLP